MHYYNQGIIQLIIIILMFVIILSLLGVSLSTLFGNKTLRENFSFIWIWAKIVWNKYLGAPASYGFDIFIEFIWKPFVAVMKGVKEAGPPQPPQ